MEMNEYSKDDPLVICEKHYVPQSKKSSERLIRCVKTPDGWQCPICKTVYSDD